MHAQANCLFSRIISVLDFHVLSDMLYFLIQALSQVAKLDPLYPTSCSGPSIHVVSPMFGEWLSSR